MPAGLDRGRARHPLLAGEREPGRVTGLGRPVAAEGGGSRTSRLLQHRPPGLGAALGRVRGLGARHMPHRPMAQLQQMPDGPARAVGLVGVDHAVAVPGVRVHDHHVDTGGQLHGGGVEQMDLHDDDDGVHRQLAHPREGAQHVVLRGHVDGDEGDRVALGGGMRGDRLHGAAAARGRQAEQDHPDGVEPAVTQRAGRAVGPVAELAHRGQHLLPGGSDHPGMPVGHPRDRLRGDTGEFGDVRHGDPLLAAPARHPGTAPPRTARGRCGRLLRLVQDHRPTPQVSFIHRKSGPGILTAAGAGATIPTLSSLRKHRHVTSPDGDPVHTSRSGCSREHVRLMFT